MRRKPLSIRSLVGIAALLPLLFVSGASPRMQAQSAITCDPSLIIAATPASAGASPTSYLPLPFPADPGAVTIFAAASLTDAFGAIEADLERATPGLDLIFNFAGSQALATQLAEGAQADLFASANMTQMANAIAAGVIAGEPAIFATNRLLIVVPADNPAGIATPADLADDGVQLVLAEETVPVGQYARESLCLMGSDAATYGEDFVDRVAGNIVSNETNVRSVLAKVQLGEADAGIVYVSDIAAGVADVSTIEIPESVNRIAGYPIAPVAGGNQENAAAFISYLLSDAGQATMAAFGFQTP